VIDASFRPRLAFFILSLSRSFQPTTIAGESWSRRGGSMKGSGSKKAIREGSEKDLLEESRVLVKQVRELRRLVPCREPCGLGELFQDAASHIEDLQVQVKVMRMLLDKLSDSDE
jgi:hypothetical protein